MRELESLLWLWERWCYRNDSLPLCSMSYLGQAISRGLVRHFSPILVYNFWRLAFVRWRNASLPRSFARSRLHWNSKWMERGHLECPSLWKFEGQPWHLRSNWRGLWWFSWCCWSVYRSEQRHLWSSRCCFSRRQVSSIEFPSSTFSETGISCTCTRQWQFPSWNRTTRIRLCSLQAHWKRGWCHLMAQRRFWMTRRTW